MKARNRVLPALLLSLFAAAAAPGAGAAQFSNVYVFGDSLSDAGYYRPFLASLGLPAPVVATLGRFTTNPGPVWSEIISQFYGVAPAPSNANGGNIFAQGGARVASASASTPPGSAQRPVSTQIDEYLARGNGAADPGALYTVWAGANDLFQNLAVFQAGGITASQLQANVLGAATAEIGQIARLQAAGARYVMVVGLPDIGATPAFASAGAATAGSVTALSAGYNTTLFTGLASAGIRVIPVDAFTFLSEIRANPSAYGFTNTTGIACGPFPPITTASTVSSQFCGPTNLVAPDAGQTYLFADSVHPTAAAQAIFAQFAESMIEGPTQLSLLAEAPLRSRASHVHSIDNGLLAARQAPVGKLTVFVGGDGGKFDIDSGTGNTGLASDQRSASVGLTMRAAEAVTLGLAYGETTGDGSFGTNAGSFHTREQVYTVFGALNWGGFYGTGILSIANIDFRDVRRNVVLGPVVRVANSSPDGSNGSAFFNAGYDFAMGGLRIGPTVSVNAQNVTVNAFDESGAGAADLHISEQTRRSEVWSAGLRASMNMGAWTPWLRVTADHERGDDARFVTAQPLSLASGNAYDIPAYSADSSFTTAAIGVHGWVGERLALGVSYFKIFGRSGIKEDGVSGTLSYRF
jgi:outer membrane lipase/esterase